MEAQIHCALEGQVGIMQHLRVVGDRRHEGLRKDLDEMAASLAQFADAQAVEDRDA